MSALLLVLAASVVAFALLETRFGARRRADARHVRTDLAYVASDFAGNLAVNALRPGFPLALAWLFGQAWQGPVAGWHPLAQLALGAVVLEWAIWFTHWCWHRFDVLYPFHAVHHASTHVYFLSGLRQHPVQFVGDQVFFALLLTLIGVQPELVGLLAILQMVLAFFTHSNLDLRLRGGLKYVVASPRFHVLHHDRSGRGDYKNLGGGLSLFDWLFGTALDPDEVAPPEALGSGDPTVPPGWRGQLLWPFRALRRAS